jgi:hypothetical protein
MRAGNLEKNTLGVLPAKTGMPSIASTVKTLPANVCRASAHKSKTVAQLARTLQVFSFKKPSLC